MNKESVQRKIRDLIDSYEPITSLMRVSREIEQYGGVGDEEREKLNDVFLDCKALAEGIENILKE